MTIALAVMINWAAILVILGVAVTGIAVMIVWRISKKRREQSPRGFDVVADRPNGLTDSPLTGRQR